MDPKEILGVTIKFQNLEISANDFPERMDWNSAEKLCQELGEGWRLPTKKELQLLFNNQEEIGGFTRLDYWSSTEGTDAEFAWYKNFFKGGNSKYKKFLCRVRAVRDLV